MTDEATWLMAALMLTGSYGYLKGRQHDARRRREMRKLTSRRWKP